MEIHDFEKDEDPTFRTRPMWPVYLGLALLLGGGAWQQAQV